MTMTASSSGTDANRGGIGIIAKTEAIGAGETAAAASTIKPGKTALESPSPSSPSSQALALAAAVAATLSARVLPTRRSSWHSSCSTAQCSSTTTLETVLETSSRNSSPPEDNEEKDAPDDGASASASQHNGTTNTAMTTTTRSSDGIIITEATNNTNQPKPNRRSSWHAGNMTTPIPTSPQPSTTDPVILVKDHEDDGHRGEAHDEEDDHHHQHNHHRPPHHHRRRRHRHHREEGGRGPMAASTGPNKGGERSSNHSTNDSRTNATTTAATTTTKTRKSLPQTTASGVDHSPVRTSSRDATTVMDAQSSSSSTDTIEAEAAEVGREARSAVLADEKTGRHPQENDVDAAVTNVWETHESRGGKLRFSLDSSWHAGGRDSDNAKAHRAAYDDNNDKLPPSSSSSPTATGKTRSVSMGCLPAEIGDSLKQMVLGEMRGRKDEDKCHVPSKTTTATTMETIRRNSSDVNRNPTATSSGGKSQQPPPRSPPPPPAESVLLDEKDIKRMFLMIKHRHMAATMTFPNAPSCPRSSLTQLQQALQIQLQQAKQNQEDASHARNAPPPPLPSSSPSGGQLVASLPKEPSDETSSADAPHVAKSDTDSTRPATRAVDDSIAAEGEADELGERHGLPNYPPPSSSIPPKRRPRSYSTDGTDMLNCCQESLSGGRSVRNRNKSNNFDHNHALDDEHVLNSSDRSAKSEQPDASARQLQPLRSSSWHSSANAVDNKRHGKSSTTTSPSLSTTRARRATADGILLADRGHDISERDDSSRGSCCGSDVSGSGTMITVTTAGTLSGSKKDAKCGGCGGGGIGPMNRLFRGGQRKSLSTRLNAPFLSTRKSIPTEDAVSVDLSAIIGTVSIECMPEDDATRTDYHGEQLDHSTGTEDSVSCVQLTGLGGVTTCNFAHAFSQHEMCPESMAGT